MIKHSVKSEISFTKEKNPMAKIVDFFIIQNVGG